ncbi:peptidoglycan-associated lipoprotein Pal [Loktanella sp. SALINAS62]|uniref:peptidoglycan-associated lipoprotein Pal n=1 Tax=Loktanella sp. SALINAS62 TaxID=2706124 RepID=UPI001B8B244B|nr:peptidoglycan-associated lipoprotein Pal [Loktanella sp. SALINAS62]MBS1300850.1 peptidoglycan-associated lipoprotein Pal [Loktanella sp. SALINAS62]
MHMMTKIALIGLALATSACTRPDRFGGTDPIGTNPVAGQNAGGVSGGVSDPRSPQYFQQTVGDRVLFAVDTSTLSPQGIATLDGQANWLQTNADYLAIIEGHADEQGTREYNLALGARRANAVREYLMSKGIPSNRLRTVSYGKERPIEVCSNEACYAKNRRAVTVISIGQLS